MKKLTAMDSVGLEESTHITGMTVNIDERKKNVEGKKTEDIEKIIYSELGKALRKAGPFSFREKELKLVELREFSKNILETIRERE